MAAHVVHLELNDAATSAGRYLDEAGALLDAMLGTDGWDPVDIETDDDLLVRYAHRIPVLAVDGTDRLELMITRPDVESVLGE